MHIKVEEKPCKQCLYVFLFTLFQLGCLSKCLYHSVISLAIFPKKIWHECSQKEYVCIYITGKDQCLLFQNCIVFIAKKNVINNFVFERTQSSINSC